MTKEEKQYEADRFLHYIEGGMKFAEAMLAANRDLRKWSDAQDV